MGAECVFSVLSWLTVTHFRQHAEKEMYEVFLFYEQRRTTRGTVSASQGRTDGKKAAALREYGDFETVFSFERLYESYRASVRGVGWKASTQRYKAASLANVTKTHEELIAGRYRSKGFYEFDIVERGKPRHIRSVHISERVVQRCLCDYCLVPMLSRSFIYDNGASLRGKGYDFAVSRVTHFLAEHYRKHGREGYVLVFDFQSISIRHSMSPFSRVRAERHRRPPRRALEIFYSELRRRGARPREPSLADCRARPAEQDRPLYQGRARHEVLRSLYGRRVYHQRVKGKARDLPPGTPAAMRRARYPPQSEKTQIIKLTRGFTFVKVRFRYGANGKVVRRATYKGIRHMRAKLRISGVGWTPAE